MRPVRASIYIGENGGAPREGLPPKVFCAGILFVLLNSAAAAGTNEIAQTAPASVPSLFSYFSDWFPRVDKTRAEQPHWAPPVVTVSPNLQEVFRYDLMRQSLANGSCKADHLRQRQGRGIHSPTEHIQFIVGIPAWQTAGHVAAARTAGRAQNFLMKYRFLSANEDHGNYVPHWISRPRRAVASASYPHHFVLTPSVAAGKAGATSSKAPLAFPCPTTTRAAAQWHTDGMEYHRAISRGQILLAGSGSQLHLLAQRPARGLNQVFLTRRASCWANSRFGIALE